MYVTDLRRGVTAKVTVRCGYSYIVTVEGLFLVHPMQLAEAGAKFRETGAPANLEAWMLVDFCTLALNDEWRRDEALQ